MAAPALQPLGRNPKAAPAKAGPVTFIAFLKTLASPELAMPIAVLGIVMAMFTPLPTFFLDVVINLFAQHGYLGVVQVIRRVQRSGSRWHPEGRCAFCSWSYMISRCCFKLLDRGPRRWVPHK